jgi:alkylmercury lyase
VQTTLATWPDIETDSNGRVVGFGGLSLTATTHRLQLTQGILYTWCAYDPLFIVPLLGETARVESTCPTTRRTITLTVTPGGVHGISPRDAVLSFVIPEPDSHDDVRQRFCNHVRYFASSEASTSWLDQRQGAFVLPIEEAFELAMRANRAKFGAPVSTGEPGPAGLGDRS